MQQTLGESNSKQVSCTYLGESNLVNKVKQVGEYTA